MPVSSRKKVEIPDKAWLEALKFLMGPQWLKMRFVSDQLAQIVQGNISDLPSIAMESASVKIWETDGMTATEMVVSDNVIETNEKSQWFNARSINLNSPSNLQPENAIIGLDMKATDSASDTISYQCADMSLVGEKKIVFEQNEMSKSWYSEQDHQYPVVFSAEFNPNLNEYSWASMEYFLNLLYNPLNYFKQVDMHALDQKLEDAFFVGETYGSYIRCGEFTLQGDIHKSLPWLQRSVRSLTIYFLGTFTDSNKEVVDFLLDASWKCASAEVKLEWVSSLEGFVKALIKKFRTFATIENAIPSIWFSSRKDQGESLELDSLLLDSEVTKLGPRDSRNAEAAYIVSNGRNRMQIEIFNRPDFEEEHDIYDSVYGEDFQLEDFQKLNIAADSSKLDEVYDVVIKFSTTEAPMSPRKNVEISDD